MIYPTQATNESMLCAHAPMPLSYIQCSSPGGIVPGRYYYDRIALAVFAVLYFAVGTRTTLSRIDSQAIKHVTSVD